MEPPFSILDKADAQILALDLGILIQTLLDLKARKTRAAAWHYIFSDEHSWPFSFIAVCRRLSYRPEKFRELLKQVKLGDVQAQIDIHKVLLLRLNGMRVKDIAMKYGVSQRTVQRWARHQEKLQAQKSSAAVA